MNPWPFVISAYVLTGLGALMVTGWSLMAMRRAEKKVDDL